ncbi:alpha-ketoglutarate-dependent dioxygenase AlkB family protein [Pseudozobellia thermophila]|uniref:Alkylated DNA repair dioxygenase AlkB n=1 Tax=Pseudozobellia thermophila TaxID=192903 RepID=A0A1M6MQF0_9FLAO|nr:alpha-ketoglutarate-dependent dioxygenase AlkB [Pseudozobellia thermophila]SHJ85626.1 Alkylated DNA repair dioxygenase AlkB [Pseudozobellia thermophila]
MQRLFPTNGNLNLVDSTIHYYPLFFKGGEADRFFDLLLHTVPWRQDSIKLFGKEYPQPRLTALFGNNGKEYSYSNITMRPHPFTEGLLEMKKKVDFKCKTRFTTCLLNLYRDGKDSNGWHSDNEKELGHNPIIASISLGEERFFHLKHRTCKAQRYKLLLEHGSLLVMSGTTQQYWMHQIPKTSRDLGKRINLTFRLIN